MNRRKVLLGGGVALSTALAGCLSSATNTDQSLENDTRSGKDDDEESPPKANLSITSATVTSNRVKAAESIEVNVTVTNSGDVEGEAKLDLKSDRREIVDQPVTVFVPARSTTNTTLRWSFQGVGEFNLSVNEIDLGTVTFEEHTGNQTESAEGK